MRSFVSRLKEESTTPRQLISLHLKEGGKFLKKLWFCVSGRVQQDNLVLSTESIT